MRNPHPRIYCWFLFYYVRAVECKQLWTQCRSHIGCENVLWFIPSNGIIPPPLFARKQYEWGLCEKWDEKKERLEKDTKLKFCFGAYISEWNWLVDTCRSRSSVGCEKMTELSFLIASLLYLATTWTRVLHQIWIHRSSRALKGPFPHKWASFYIHWKLNSRSHLAAIISPLQLPYTQVEETWLSQVHDGRIVLTDRNENSTF